MIFVLADYRLGYYINRPSGDRYFPAKGRQQFIVHPNFVDHEDRGKRLNRGATGAYEDAVLEVVKHVTRNYRTTFDRVVWGQGEGGYGAVRIAMNHPYLFVGAATQSAMLNLQLAAEPNLRAELNAKNPEFFDVFGSGTWSLDGLPTTATKALHLQMLDDHDPISALERMRLPIPVYMEVTREDIKYNEWVYNGTVDMCEQMAAMKLPGKVGVNSHDNWMVNFGKVLYFLQDTLDGTFFGEPPDCSILS